jgi:predicted nucleic acid-binding protein
MIVVSDTTPLRYLAVIGGLDWLQALFGHVVCPPEVLAECRNENAPAPLRTWADSPPSWLRIMPVSTGVRALPIEALLDVGETAALCLALELHADLVLLDERRGRAVATQLGLPLTGTLGVLVEAALHGLMDFESALTLLRGSTNFRVGEPVIAAARARLAAGIEDR